MIDYQPGEFLLVTFPFAGSAAGKVRPALTLLDTGDDDVVLARVTTHMHRTPHDVLLQDWRGAGLLAPSVVRLHKLVTSEKRQVIRVLGQLPPADRQQVAAVLRQTFGSW